MPFASTWMSLLVVVGLQALGTAGDLLPVNRRTDMVGRKPVTIWPLSDAAQMHVHSPELAQALPVLLQPGIPVVDLGCGVGYYVAELAKLGYTAHGVEGTPNIEDIALHKPIHHADLSEPLAIPLPDGHVLSFEVAEHLSPDDEPMFLDNVVQHARARLLLSWALPDACLPGRGHGHLNCRSNLYVIRALFLRGFTFHHTDSLWLRERVRGSAAYWFVDTILIFDHVPLSKLSLAELEEHGASRTISDGSRGRIHTAPATTPGSAEDHNAGHLPACAGRALLREPADASVLLADAGDAVDVNVDVALQGCAETALSMVCALVFVDGRPSEASPVVCPRIGEAGIAFTLYGFTRGKYNLTVVPCSSSGFAALGLSASVSVVVREAGAEARGDWSPGRDGGVADLFGRSGGGDEGTEACGGGESEESGLNCRVASRLRERVRDLLTELSDIRALLRERVRASGRGLGTVGVDGAGEMEASGGLGKLERLLGLDTDMVDEIVELVSRGAGGGGAGAALAEVLDCPLGCLYKTPHV